MKLGVSVGYWGFGLTAADQLDIARTAEELGYDSVWTAEAYGSDAATVLAWLAAGTSKIKLGAGIFQIPARSAAMTAMTAATIDQLSGGRFILGLGTSGPQVSEGWHGVRFAKQLQRTREYVAVVRMALAHQKVEFHGETLELPLPDGPGKVLKLTIRPAQERIPIYLAVLGPKNVALAAEIADRHDHLVYCGLRERMVAAIAGGGAAAKAAATVATVVVIGGTIGVTHVLDHGSATRHHDRAKPHPAAVQRASVLPSPVTVPPIVKEVASTKQRAARGAHGRRHLSSRRSASSSKHLSAVASTATREPGGFAYLGVPSSTQPPSTSASAHVASSSGGGQFSP